MSEPHETPEPQVVRFPPEQDSREAVQAARNDGSGVVPGAFASFETESCGVQVGIQLTAIGGPLDAFWRYREVLLAREDLRDLYDDLKRSFDGKWMVDYRAAKDEFFATLRGVPEFESARLK